MSVAGCPQVGRRAQCGGLSGVIIKKVWWCGGAGCAWVSRPVAIVGGTTHNYFLKTGGRCTKHPPVSSYRWGNKAVRSGRRNLGRGR